MPVALILAGGYGKRLRPLTLETPKPLIEVAGKPIIVHQLEWLRYYGIDEIYVLAGYLKEKLIETLGSGARFGVQLSYIIEDEPLGTGGALRNASHVISKNKEVIVVNGDVITNIDPLRLVETLRGNIIAAMATVPLRSPYGVLEVDDGLITGFREKPIIRDYWINAGVYAFKPDIIEYLPDKGDIEKTSFPLIASKRLLVGVKYDTPPYYWRSVDSHKDIEEVTKELEEIGGLLPVEESRI